MIIIYHKLSGKHANAHINRYDAYYTKLYRIFGNIH